MIYRVTVAIRTVPEIVYGGFLSADKAYNGTEYGYEPLVSRFSDSDEVLVFGLCNGAIGYIVPDNDYSASNEDGHYEETVSTGKTAASSVSKVFHGLLDIWGVKNNGYFNTSRSS